MDEPDHVGLSGTPGRGPYLVLYLRLADGRIEECTFQSHGCGPTIASGSMLTEMILGESIERCLTISNDELIQALDGLPPDKRHCAGFAVNALRQALDDYEATGA